MTHRRNGLTRVEAERRLSSEGPNELPSGGRRGLPEIVIDVLKEPMFSILIGAGLIYLALGDLEEALVLIVFAALSTIITVVQEHRSERILEALSDLTSPRATVIRDGETVVIPGREVVRGDIALLAEGDRVPADCVLIEASHLEADESLLTGESVPVRKSAGTVEDWRRVEPGGDGLSVAFSGSMVVRGTGRAEIVATGAQSRIGMIGQTLSRLDVEPPRLKAETTRLVRLSAIGAALVFLLTVGLYASLRGGWLDALLAGIAIGMSMLPEEFPVVMTVFMAMGAWRISKARVLTRRAAAIETLGAATVLCTDKTGTLTENRMTVSQLWQMPGVEDPEVLALTAAAASNPDPFDPMEKAFHALVASRAIAAPAARGWTLARLWALDPQLLAMTLAWSKPDGTVILATKGAPEAVADLCGLSEAERESVRAATGALAEKGLRVLAVATGSADADALPDHQRGLSLSFLGLIGLSDPLRQSVHAAIAQCRTAGIRVVMITGDYPVTARAIGAEAGLAAETILTGAELAAMDDAALDTAITRVDIFARIMPEQKLRIVEALKRRGEIVAMTGDGVNDAPSLKAAHIGVAMGGRGTDVAREASAIVLLDDDFSSIVTAIRLGRRIYDNLRKAMGFIVAVHVPIAGLALMPLVTGLPILFWPIHIAFLEMIIDPVCSLAYEAEVEERNTMKRPPRRPDQPLFSWPLVAWSLMQGGLAFAATASVYLLALDRGLEADQARTLTFAALVVALLTLVLVNRSFSTSLIRALTRPNRMLAVVVALVIAIGAAALFVPQAAQAFRFGPVGAELAIVMGLVFASLLLTLEALKALLARRLRF